MDGPPKYGEGQAGSAGAGSVWRSGFDSTERVFFVGLETRNYEPMESQKQLKFL